MTLLEIQKASTGTG